MTTEINDKTMNVGRPHIRHSVWASLWGCLVFLVALSSCKPSIPRKYLQPGQLEAILYDYHIAEGIQQLNGGGADSLAMLSYRANILKKHGVSEADFDSTMLYYTRHTKLLHDVYEALADRLNREALAQGSTASDLSRYGNISSSSDTTDVWPGERAFVLSPYQASNRYAFEVKVDSAFHRGDKMLLDFDTQFIYQDGMRDVAAVLVVTFENDSVSTQVVHASSASHYHVQAGGDGLGIKRVRGFFLLTSSGYAAPSTTLRLLVVNNVRLIRLHTANKEEKPATDTLKTDRQSGGATPPPPVRSSGDNTPASVQGRPIGPLVNSRIKH